MSACSLSLDIPGVLTAANDWIEIKVHTAGRRLAGVTFTDKLNGCAYRFGDDIFSIHLDYGIKEDGVTDDAPRPRPRKISAASLMAETPAGEEIPGNPQGRRLADRRSGVKITVPFAWETEGLAVTWTAELREGSPYVRILLDICPMQWACPIRMVRVLELSAPDIQQRGSVKGVPATAFGGRLFAGVESPLSFNGEEEGKLVAQISRKTDIPSRTHLNVSAVLGVAAPGQLRRTFQLQYLNEERARPYGAFLNYNTWYDTLFDRYDEAFATEAVRLYGEELVRKRGAVLDSILFDDGWDNPETLWEFNEGFKHEFRNINKLAASYGAGPGVWFSPWGGYGKPKQNRLNAAGDCFETNERGFALSGPRYYDYFKEMCLHMIRDNGINHFKLDGTSGEETQLPGSRFASDFEAVIHLLGELRDERPDLFINLTTGTWASPFWFGIADSVWRGGWDHEFIGEGTMRQKWMTFRDSRIFNNNVAVSPLFPINSLMNHGIIYTRKARGLDTVEGTDLEDEIWSAFGSGTQMQEIYMTPQLLEPSQWDTLARAAIWARENNETLVDVHWVGGSPMELQVYGWAAWSPVKGLLTIRNPSSERRTWSFDPGAVFELPPEAPRSYSAPSPNGKRLPFSGFRAGEIVRMELEPFEVIVVEALPEPQP